LQTKYKNIEELPLFPKIQDGSLANEWVEIGLTKGPRVSFNDVRAFFEYLNLPLNTIIWAKDPICAGRACRLAKAKIDLSQWHEQDIPETWVNEQLQNHECPNVDYGDSFWCQLNADWMADALAFEHTGLDLTPAKLYEPLVRGAGWSFYANGVCILSLREQPNLNTSGLLHNSEGPAIYDKIYALQGIVIPPHYEWIVKNPDSLNHDTINQIQNAEIRRVTIASFPEKYVTGEPVQSDSYGELYDIKDPDDPSTSFRVVRVKDAMSERVYWLRVPPHVSSAHEGVASTFGMTADQYQPQLQT
jgi:hypothetical protein